MRHVYCKTLADWVIERRDAKTRGNLGPDTRNEIAEKTRRLPLGTVLLDGITLKTS